MVTSVLSEKKTQTLQLSKDNTSMATFNTIRQVGRKEFKAFLFVDDVILYMRISSDPIEYIS